MKAACKASAVQDAKALDEAMKKACKNFLTGQCNLSLRELYRRVPAAVRDRLQLRTATQIMAYLRVTRSAYTLRMYFEDMSPTAQMELKRNMAKFIIGVDYRDIKNKLVKK